ncbi:2-amino-4-hydroxy-6-hydroxymethyldihydropteridinediphosphokinase [soil metagenome]
MQVGIALGSNIEPRLLNLQAAGRRLQSLHRGAGEILASPIYETSPVDCPVGSPNFLNAVVEIVSDLQPETLLKYLQTIEMELGRPSQRTKNSPRTVDLDMLYCDEFTLDGPSLILPHPRIAERLFVLKPLANIRPDLKLPNYRSTIKTLFESYSGSENPTIVQNANLLA